MKFTRARGCAYINMRRQSRPGNLIFGRFSDRKDCKHLYLYVYMAYLRCDPEIRMPSFCPFAGVLTVPWSFF